ncbi:MAG: 5-dehydro-2-deoxygluconokinase [Immundisolibacterales bacterium]|nr:5-dehydro-2-deoxygluconokinase [Immundisolibacterales bacterium]
MKTLDAITYGRSSVDLYGTQVGGRLEDMASFKKYIGGSPTNIAAGLARLGMRSAVITRVGDEHMGRFIREQLVREGVDVRGVKTDPQRLTALVLLGIRDDRQFPLIFYREDCADMALCEDDVDPDFIAEARSFTVTGTHLSHPRPEAGALKALRLARANGARTALDIDYRPNLWGVAGHGEGESRYVESAGVTAKLQSNLPLFDLIVGTEEEFHIAGGSTDTVAALRAVRAITEAVLVCKRGPMGSVVFEGAIPDRLEDGVEGPGFPIEVFNVLGAGDGYMAGLLKGWLDGEEWPTTLKYANACGALAVSRHGCTPSYPSREELEFFFERGVRTPALRNDAELEHVHWATNRRGEWPEVRIFAFDHRAQMVAAAAEAGADPGRIHRFKELCLEAALEVASGRSGYGILSDWEWGRNALYAAAGRGMWIGRPVEVPGSRPLELDIGRDPGSALQEWPVEHVVKVLCRYHPGDAAQMKASQEDTIVRLARAARANGLELMLEVIASGDGPMADGTTAEVIQRFYDLGVRPDWWKIEPMAGDAAWSLACGAVERNDPWCRGMVVLGRGQSEERLAESFAAAARHRAVKGFAVGRTIFAAAARDWLAGEADDGAAVADMAARYGRLCAEWDRARAIDEGEGT